MKSKEATRQKALEAATAVFVEKGYDGATLREIALRAGITEMTLLRHFGTKDSILREALLEKSPSMPADAGKLPEDLDEAIATASRRLWKGMMGPRRALLKTLVGESVRRPAFGEPLSHVPREFSRQLGEYLRVKQGEGVVRPGEPRLQALALLGLYFSLAVGGDFMADEVDYDEEQVISAYTDIYLNGIRRDAE